METIFLRGAALGLTAAAAPGLFQTFLINQSLAGGWRRSAPIAFSPLVSDAPIVTLILLVLNQMPGNLLRWIGLIGGLFALYIARKLFSDWKRPQGKDKETQTAAGTTWDNFWKGALMNALSPGPYTFWSLVNGPILLSALRNSWLDGSLFLLGFYSLFIGGMLVIVGVFHQARRFGPNVIRWLALASIIILSIFGLLLIIEAIIPK